MLRIELEDFRVRDVISESVVSLSGCLASSPNFTVDLSPSAEVRLTDAPDDSLRDITWNF